MNKTIESIIRISILGALICGVVVIMLLLNTCSGGKETSGVGTGGKAGNDLLPVSGEATVEPYLWYSCVYNPYAIVEILSVDDERAFSDWISGDRVYYVKASCRVVFSHGTDGLLKTEVANESDVEETSSDSFDNLSEIYITENVADKMKNARTVLIPVSRIYDGDQLYIVPEKDAKGCSKFAPITENGLNWSDSNIADYYLNILNAEVSSNNRREQSTDYKAAMPSKELCDGMSVEEVRQYFGAWEEAAELYKAVLRELNGVDD